MNCRLHSVWGPCPICDAKRISDLTKELAAANARADAAQAEAGALREALNGACAALVVARRDHIVVYEGGLGRTGICELIDAALECARAALAKVQP